MEDGWEAGPTVKIEKPVHRPLEYLSGRRVYPQTVGVEAQPWADRWCVLEAEYAAAVSLDLGGLRGKGVMPRIRDDNTSFYPLRWEGKSYPCSQLC